MTPNRTARLAGALYLAMMPLEEFTARVVWNGFVFLACVAMAIVVWRFRKRERALGLAV